MPEVSVVVPTRNRSALLAQTLRTVLWQQNVDLEVIVIDEGSTDDTASIVASLHDPRVRIVRHDIPQGVATARNRGAEEATGQWMAFVDDDDLWAPDKLSLQLASANRSGRSWVYVGEVHVTLGLQVIGGGPPLAPDQLVQSLTRRNTVPGGGSGVAIHQDAFRAVGGFDPRFIHHADWDLWIRLSRAGPPAWVCRPLLGYRIHDQNRSLETAGMVTDLENLERRHRIRVDWVAFYRYVALLSLRAGTPLAALRYYVRAATQQPGYALTRFTPDVLKASSLKARQQTSDLLHGVWRLGGHRVATGPGVSPRRRGHDKRLESWWEEGQSWLEQVSDSTTLSL